MATLTYVFDEDTVPSAKDTMIADEAEKNGLIVNAVPDVYPGLAGELEISGDPELIMELLQEASDANAPGSATRLTFTAEEAGTVEDMFEGCPLELEQIS